MKATVFVLLAAITHCVLCAPRDWLEQEWGAWRDKHGRSYETPEEEAMRRGIWEDNYNLVELVNNRKDAVFTLEMNQFADGILQGRPKIRTENHGSPVVKLEDNLPSAPKSFDWRTKGVISPVQNQGALGDPLSITAEECVQSFDAIKTGKLVGLSTAEVQDCCSQDFQQVFDCIHNIGGLCGTSTYPVVTGHCRNNSCQPEVQIAGGQTVPPQQPDQMVAALLQRPLLVFLDASMSSFEMYTSGIYSDPDCSKQQVDHTLQVVGYGEENGQQFWICKNSWGKTWGEEGYVRILKGADVCGIESFATYPI